MPIATEAWDRLVTLDWRISATLEGAFLNRPATTARARSCFNVSRPNATIHGARSLSNALPSTHSRTMNS